MYHIQTLNKISPAGLRCFPSNAYQYGDEVKDPDAILVRSAPVAEKDLADNLLCIARAGAGVNNIPVEKCSEQGIVVFNTPGANANAVKELVIAMMILTSRKIIPAVRWTQELRDRKTEIPALVEKGKGAFVGPEIAGKRLGVIGLGAIGILVANAADALGMEVLGYDPYLSVESAWQLSRSVKPAQNLQKLFETCDFITVHVPLTKDTSEMIRAESIAHMKDGVRILNFARGDLVVAADILAALQSGKIAAYATDFPTEELLGAEGVIVTPHLGASTPESEDNCAQMAVEEIIDFLENGNIKHSVNLPEAVMPRAGEARVCVIHKNIPNMLAQISGAVSQSNINIENMLNKSKKDAAYTMLDIDGDAKSAAAAIAKVDGVIRVRVI